MKKDAEPINWVGQPKRICGNCQHFKARKSLKEQGDCHNLISGRWRTGPRDEGCKRGWYPDVTRWPIEKIYQGGNR